MLGGNDQLERRVVELMEVVNVLSGQVAALMAYVAQISPPIAPDLMWQMQGTAQQLSRPPANGRWKRLFAWDEGCGGKHAGKIDADG